MLAAATLEGVVVFVCGRCFCFVLVWRFCLFAVWFCGVGFFLPPPPRFVIFSFYFTLWFCEVFCFVFFPFFFFLCGVGFFLIIIFFPPFFFFLLFFPFPPHQPPAWVRLPAPPDPMMSCHATPVETFIWRLVEPRVHSPCIIIAITSTPVPQTSSRPTMKAAFRGLEHPLFLAWGVQAKWLLL